MASDPFTVWTSQLMTPALPLVPGEITVLASSGEVENGPTARPSLLVELEYELITPNITAGSPPFSLLAVIETKTPTTPVRWVPLMYQFSQIRNLGDPTKRILRMQPDISDFNAGIDDSIFLINRESARISRQQGFLPDQPFRVCILVVDNDPTGPNKFVSAVVSASGERYDHI